MQVYVAAPYPNTHLMCLDGKGARAALVEREGNDDTITTSQLEGFRVKIGLKRFCFVALEIRCLFFCNKRLINQRTSNQK